MQTTNKRIAKNTIYLYFRMIVVMFVNLYVVRVVLDLLGVVDYGIYNVVGGVVSIFSFLNGTLSTSSQRFFSVALAKNDAKRLNEYFSSNIEIFIVFLLAFILFAESVGLWFVNTKMTIPEERIQAANIIYQFSIIAFCFNFLSIPYTALIIAHEKMNAFAYISIVEAILKLLIVYVLTLVSWDKLIGYGLLTMICSGGIMLSYVLYCHWNFDTARFRPYWNKTDMKELVGFSGWHFLGTFSGAIRSHGINILLNVFFNPAINAARAVAFQVYNALNQLSSNFFTAVKPQIYKLYTDEDYNAFYKLLLRSTIICSLLVSILIFPIIANTGYILSLWLKEIPDYTVIFCRLVLINGLIDSMAGPAIAAALATGKIRNFQLIVATLTCLNLPISYIALKLGAAPYITMLVSIMLSILLVIVRAYLLRTMVGLPFGKYLGTAAKIAFVSVAIGGAVRVVFFNKANSFIGLTGWSFAIMTLVGVLYLLIVLDNGDRKTFLKYVKHLAFKKGVGS